MENSKNPGLPTTSGTNSTGGRPCPSRPPVARSPYERLQGWEDRNPELKVAIIGLGSILIMVAFFACFNENGWSLIGQSLKETFWPW